MSKLYSGKKPSDKKLAKTAKQIERANRSVAKANAKRKSKAKKKQAKQEKKLTIGTYNTRLRKLLEQGGAEQAAYIRDVLETKTGIDFTRAGNINTKQELTKEQRQVVDRLLPQMGKKFDMEGYIKDLDDRITGEKRSLEEKQIMAFQDRAKKLAMKSFDDFFEYIYEEGSDGSVMSGANIGEGTYREGIAKSMLESATQKRLIKNTITDIARGIKRGDMSKADVERKWSDLEELTGIKR